MNNPLGVMQGRLLPKYQGRYQAHPVGYWHEEFLKAASLKLDCIEFILDYHNAEQNPLLTTEGQKQIRMLSEKTGVQVLTVCADYFMEAPLNHESKSLANESKKILVLLLHAAKKLGVRDVVIPCVDHSSIQQISSRKIFMEKLEEIIPEAEQCGVNLSLETDLNPSEFSNLLRQLDSPRVTVNYDIGNSASLGFDPAEELDAYGERISDVHIKDRTKGGGSVELGTGNADIPCFLKLLKSIQYQGPLIMQAFRDDDGIDIFVEQLQWIKAVSKELDD